MSLDNIWLRSNDSFVRVSCVRSFAFSVLFAGFIPFVRVSCVCFVYRAFFVFLRVKRLVRFVNLYDPGSVHLFSTHVLFKSVLFKYLNYYHICDFKYLLDKM